MVKRSPLRTMEKPRRTGAADHARAERTGRSAVAKTTAPRWGAGERGGSATPSPAAHGTLSQ